MTNSDLTQEEFKKKFLTKLKTTPDMLDEMMNHPMYMAIKGLIAQNLNEEQINYILTVFFHESLNLFLSNIINNNYIKKEVVEGVTTINSGFLMLFDDEEKTEYYNKVVNYSAAKAHNSLIELKKEFLKSGMPEELFEQMFGGIEEKIEEEIKKDSENNIIE